MRIENVCYTIDRADVPDVRDLPRLVESLSEGKLLRWYVTDAEPGEFRVEATLCDLVDSPAWASHTSRPGSKSVVLNIIPTGVGCEFGGYAGDAGPVTSLFAACADYVITNPNAVNASNFINIADNVLYVEGCCIDLFCQGKVDLYRPYGNRVGLVVEQTDDRNLEVVFNIVNMARAVHGVDLEHWEITDEPVGGRCVQNASGAYVGTVDNPGTLLRACERLLRKGVDAVALTTDIRDLPPDLYARHYSGKHPNPVGGVEAVISHMVCHRFRVPAAHAPMVCFKDFDLESRIVDARGSGEIASNSGLATVLVGLRRAPRISAERSVPTADLIQTGDLLAVVAPASCLGGVPALFAAKNGVPLIAVHANETVLDVSASKLGLVTLGVDNYMEAAGMIMALKSGLSPAGLRRPLKTLFP